MNTARTIGYFDAKAGDRAVPPRLAELTPRELEVLAYIGEGLSISEIAERLHRGYATIKSHRLMLGRKLGVSNRVELARIAMETGLAPLVPDRAGAGFATTGDALRMMQTIEHHTRGHTGQAYFRALVEHLAQTLEVRCTLLGALDPASPEKVNTLAVWADGAHVENFSFDLHGTPCEKAIDQGLYFCESKLRSRFTCIPQLEPLEVDSYIGAAMLTKLGRPNGLLAAAHDRPLKIDFGFQAILRIFAARATVELQNLQIQRPERS